MFLDNCILSHALVLEGAEKLVPPPFAGFVRGYKRKPLPSGSQEWLGEEISCLPTIAKLAMNGEILPCIYSETRNEAWKRPGSFPRMPIQSVFRKISFQVIDAAVERSYFMSMRLQEFLQTEQFIQFCKLLIKPKTEEFATAELTPSLPKQMKENLMGVQRFRDLCHGLSESQYPNAFHLWTAETHKLDYFLTVHKKFINVITQTKKIPLRLKICMPSVLLKDLNILERVPFEFEEGVFYNIGGYPEGRI